MKLYFFSFCSCYGVGTFAVQATRLADAKKMLRENQEYKEMCRSYKSYGVSLTKAAQKVKILNGKGICAFVFLTA